MPEYSVRVNGVWTAERGFDRGRKIVHEADRSGTVDGLRVWDSDGRLALDRRFPPLSLFHAPRRLIDPELRHRPLRRSVRRWLGLARPPYWQTGSDTIDFTLPEEVR